MKRLVFTLIFILLAMTMITAATNTQVADDTFQLNDIINYSKPCINNNTLCSASVCNFTVQKPDSNFRFRNRTAGESEGYHFTEIAFDELGIWKIDQFCIDGTDRGSETFYAEVTGSGLNNNVWFFAIILAISFGVMVIGFSIKDAPFVIFGSFGLYFVGLYILFNGIAGIKDPTTTWATGIIILGLAFYISARSSYELITG